MSEPAIAELVGRDGGEIEVEGRQVRLSSLGKVLWPSTGFTKGQMLDYYIRAAPALLPHIAGRALTLGRFPSGVGGPGFAQTECRGRPDWVATRRLALRDGTVRSYCVAADLPSLLWIVNQGTIELHPFLARGDRPGEPDVVAFDVDPGPGTGQLECCRMAIRLRRALASEGLTAFAKTSGSVGMHVYVPLNAPHGYAQTKAFARATAERLAAEHPNEATASMSQSNRYRKVFLDWLQNDERRSTVAPYSLRATDRPAVSAPVAWEEVEQALAEDRERSLTFGARDVLDRLHFHGDLFRPVLETTQSLPEPFRPAHGLAQS